MTSADGDAMTGLPMDGQFRSAGPDLAGSEAIADARSGRPIVGRAARTSPPRPRRLAALGLAAADVHAHRADPAVPAGAGERARVGTAAGGHRPGGRHPVLRSASRAGAVPEPTVAVQRFRGALVRRHLPAAVRVPRRLRAAARVPVGSLGPAAAAAGAAEPGPAAGQRQLFDRAAAGPGPAVSPQPARPSPVPADRRRRLGFG